MRYAILALACISLSACATITQGTSQQVSVTTDPEQSAHCTLKNSVGSWDVTTPGSAKVHKSSTNLVVTCDNAADPVSVKPKYNVATAGNMMAGGLIGLAIDAGNGANYTYPAHVVVPMGKAAP